MPFSFDSPIGGSDSESDSDISGLTNKSFFYHIDLSIGSHKNEFCFYRGMCGEVRTSSSGAIGMKEREGEIALLLIHYLWMMDEN